MIVNEHAEWSICQRDSDQILSAGLQFLTSNPAVSWQDVRSNAAGNYVITLNDQILYVGEARNLSARIRQQFNSKSSTFYKTYCQRNMSPQSIGEFRLGHMETAIGRKEIEEFGMVNAGCPLNKFQRDKRSVVSATFGPTLWLAIQQHQRLIIEQGEAAVLSAPFRPWPQAVARACAGLYVVQAPRHGDILYVGESSDIRERYNVHSTRTYFSALRRHLGTEVLGLVLQERKGKAKYFSENEDQKVSACLASCSIACVPIAFGRYELETHLIKKYRPPLNRKDMNDS